MRFYVSLMLFSSRISVGVHHPFLSLKNVNFPYGTGAGGSFPVSFLEVCVPVVSLVMTIMHIMVTASLPGRGTEVK